MHPPARRERRTAAGGAGCSAAPARDVDRAPRRARQAGEQMAPGRPPRSQKVASIDPLPHAGAAHAQADRLRLPCQNCMTLLSHEGLSLTDKLSSSQKRGNFLFTSPLILSSIFIFFHE